MAIVFTQTLPEGTPIQMLDEVTEEMGVDSDPPAGMIVHTHFEQDGRVKILDVWESAAAHDTFAEERLGPAFRKVAERNGMDATQMPEPETKTIEVHRVVRGR
jgi:hypothetical protein